jgi:hypothetical protein
MAAGQCIFNGFGIFQRRFTPDLRVGPGPQTLGELFTDLELGRCL